MRKLYGCLLVSVLMMMQVQAGPQEEQDSGYIQVENGKLYYETAGQGEETLVFIHDGLVHSAVWDQQFPVFSETFRVVRYDRRGYGRSPKPETAYSNVDDLDRVFTTLHIEKAILVGMSAGGGLTIDFTLAHPEKVSAFIVIGAVVSGFSYSEHLLTRGGRLSAADYADREKLLHYLITEDPYEIAPQNQSVKEKLRILMESFPQNIDLTKNNLLLPPERPAVEHLGEIRVPVLIVVGESDIPDVFVHAGAIESGCQNAQRVIVQNAGHLVPLEQPDRFNRLVLDFLNSTEFYHALDIQGAEEAARIFHEKRKGDPQWLPFTETRMNGLGYQALQSGKAEEAIELFKLNVLAYPESANTYDSLGEAYMVHGDIELAIENYRKSLELDPNNKNAEETLKRLK